MRRLRLGVGLGVALLGSASLAHGQRATERFIPIGHSPGVSGTLSTIGIIVAVDPEQRRIRVAGPAGPVTVRIEDSTRIWIDRHALGLGPTTGSFEDCREDRRAEVKYADPDTREVAEWVKLEESGDRGPEAP
jgi:hypothetical protein